MKLTQSPISKLAKVAKLRDGLNFLQLISQNDLLRICRNSARRLGEKARGLLCIGDSELDRFEIDTPRVCPACVMNGDHYQEFQSSDLVACPTHDIYLEDHCHKCQQPFKFEPNLFRGLCTNRKCFSRLKRELISDKNKILGAVHISKCIKLGNIVFSLESGNLTSKSISRIKEAFVTGNEVLTEPRLMNNLYANLLHYLCGTQMPKNFTVKALSYLFGEISVEQSNKAFNQYMNKGEADLSNNVLLTFSTFCKSVGITRDTGELLVNSGKLGYGVEARIHSDSIVDAKPFISFLNMHCDQALAGGTNLQTFIKSRPGFNANIDELFRAIVETEMPFFYRAKESFEESIEFNEQNLVNWYFKNHNYFRNEELSIHDACTLLRVNRVKLESLINNGNLALIPKPKKHTDFGYALHRHQVIDLAGQQQIQHQQALSL